MKKIRYFSAAAAFVMMCMTFIGGTVIPAVATPVVMVAAMVAEEGCAVQPKLCKDPSHTWWDCKLTWFSKQTSSEQTAKAWICALSSFSVQQEAIDAGLGCAVPPSAKPTIKCINSNSRTQPDAPLQSIDPSTELEKQPENWGDPPCDDCMNKGVCKQALFACQQNQFCGCLNTCLRQQHSTNSNGPCFNACVQFQQDPELDTALFNEMAQCATDNCNTACGNSSSPPMEDLACCKNIGCVP